jgi:hypothetical protein
MAYRRWSRRGFLMRAMAAGIDPFALRPKAGHGSGAVGISAGSSEGDPGAPLESSLVFKNVVAQFRTMASTRYEHHFHEDAGAGIYYYDCVGMTSYTMHLATPKALQAVLDDLQIRPGYVPTPSAYALWFRALDLAPHPYWDAVPRVADLRAGDILAWNVDIDTPHPPEPGHSVIAAGPPLPLSDGSFALLAFDSTATPHGPLDSRLTDPRNEIGPNGRPSGLGKGTLQLFVDGNGRPNAVAWSVGGSRKQQVFGMARPLA